MGKVSRFFDRLLNITMALFLAVMFIFVFTNVVLRYVFNSGITWSEEMSRFLFIWLTFLGAIGALKENRHLGVDTLIKRLPRQAKKLVYVIGNLLIFYLLWLLFDGSVKTTLLNTDTKAAATGLPLALVYGVGIITSLSFAVILLFNLYKVFFYEKTIDVLTVMKETEEEVPYVLREKTIVK
ncbi:hypothetical protein M493_17125 [Geobacillus genomosp. 3]|uniref:Tripartite ATP-independent periplasmic transporters DctQ component domain-containing protein n=1 Tax=Geobacillus genomosp. 3 TaxID=1921421 RepID=S5Z3K4_GEOG3|nr:TRAP transporter small permease [Geobacillus genomosp. 3]AGT33634.1 hypothetical protein M493_17125 [Geobacillus genomosp. 3]